MRRDVGLAWQNAGTLAIDGLHHFSPQRRPSSVSTPHNVYAVDENPCWYGTAFCINGLRRSNLLNNFSPGAARLRPSVASLPRLSAFTLTARHQSNVPTPAPDPKTKAQSIIDALPGNSLVSKTAILSSATGLSIAAISNELYVVNEETVVAFCLLAIFTAIGKYAGPMYSEWATSQVAKIKDILNSARTDHTRAVEERIESVKQMDNVVDVTKALFEVSKVCQPKKQWSSLNW